MSTSEVLGAFQRPVLNQDPTVAAIAGTATLTLVETVAPSNGTLIAVVQSDVSINATLAAGASSDTAPGTAVVLSVPVTAGQTVTLRAEADTGPVYRIAGSVTLLVAGAFGLVDIAALFTAKSQLLMGFGPGQVGLVIQSYNVQAFGAVGDGVTDDTAAIQAAIDAADANTFNPPYGPGNTGAPDVFFPPGNYLISSPLDWTGCNLVGDWPNSSVQIIWAGAAGATVITKNAASAGGDSYCHLKGICFAPGVNEPATWVAYPAVNDMNIVEYCEFNGCTGDALTVGGWVKCNWHHIRWNECGGYAIALAGTIARASFSISDFHYGHDRGSGGGSGFMSVTNPTGSDLGQIRVVNGRLELNTAWAGNQAVINYSPSTNNGWQLVRFCVESVIIASDVSVATYVLLYQQGHTQGLSLQVSEFQSVFGAILGGLLPTGFPTLAGKGTWQHLMIQPWGAYGAFDLSDGTDIGLVFYRNGATVATNAFRYFVDAEAEPRLTMDPVSGIKFGPGGATPTDTALERLAAGFLLSGALRLTDRLQLVKRTDPGNTSADVGQIFLQDNGAGKMQLCARFPSGAVQVLATEP
jgi:hypothetical protein